MRETLQEKKISMTKLSQRSEVSYNTIKFIVRNPYHEVYISTLTRLAQVLGVATAQLIEDVSDDEYEQELATIKKEHL